MIRLLDIFLKIGYNIFVRENGIYYFMSDEFGNDILTLEDEDGEEHLFMQIDEIEHNDVRYLAVVPISDDEDEDEDEGDELIFMRTSNEEGEEFMDVVEDEDEFVEVANIFAGRLSEEYEIKEFEAE